VHIDDAALQRALGQLEPHRPDGLAVRSALSEVTAAMPALFSVDGAGIMLIDEEQVLRYVASTDGDARLLEAVQESTGRGPCVQALVDNDTVEVGDLLEDERWLDLTEMLVPNGLRAVLGAPIHLAGAPIGSINVYRRDAHDWDGSDHIALAAFNRVVEHMVVVALASDRNDILIGQLQHALQARVVIERAVGILMAVDNLEATEAFERIRRAARSDRRAAHEVARAIIRTKRLP
jgi:hypothetical protein